MSKFKPLTGYLPIAVFCFLGVIIYSNTFHSSFHFDDTHSIVNNLNIISLSNPKAIWNFWPTRFVTYLSIALNYHFNRLDVFGYHLVNIIIHLCTTILVWRFVVLLSKTNSRSIAFFVALIFLSHPIQTQSVTYIIQRATSLAALFYMASLVLYIKSRLLQQEGSASHIGRLYYAGSVTAAIMAMFTKENTITLPFMILLCEYFFLKKDERINWKRLIPFFAAISIIPATMLVTKSVDFQNMVRVSELPTPISPLHYLLTQFRVIATYMRLLLVPFNQNIDYAYTISKSFLEVPVLASFFLIVLMLIVAIRLHSKYRLVSFSIFWFFLTLLPESSIMPIKDVIFEHRLYLPMAGYALFLTGVLYYIFENKPSKIAVTILSGIVICYSVSTYVRNFVWNDEFSLWNDAVSKSPKKARPLNNLGLAYAEKGDMDQAIAYYNKALEMDPNYYLAYNNLGLAYKEKKSDIQQAAVYYDKAIQLNPKYPESYYNRGLIHRDKAEVDQAIADYNRAVQLNPNLFQAYNELGIAYKDDFEKAIFNFTKAIKINPYYAAGYNNRGCVYKDRGETDKAISDYNQAIKIDPNYPEAHNNLGLAYKNRGDFDRAISCISKAIEIKPDYAEAYNNRGNAYREKGDFDRAIIEYNRAIQLNPELALAYRNRAKAYELKKASGR